MYSIGKRRISGIAFLVVAIIVYYLWEIVPIAEFTYIKTIIIVTSIGQFFVLSVRLNKQLTDLLDYPYYITIGIGISIAVSLNTEQVNQVKLEIATDNLNGHSDYMLELCSQIANVLQSKNKDPLNWMCSSIQEEFPLTTFWVSMTETSKDFITKTDFLANTDDFQSFHRDFSFVLDRRPNYLAMAEMEKEQIAKDLMFGAHRLRELLEKRQEMQSSILGAKRDYPSEISSWYLENWIFIVALLISFKLIKTTNSIVPGRSS